MADSAPRPEVREMLISDPRSAHASEQTQSAIAGYLSVNWDHKPAELFEPNTNPDVYSISQAFDSHISRLENWTLESDAAVICPVLFETRLRSLLSFPK